MLIFASIGLNYSSEDKLRKIILAGADGLRYTFSRGTIEQNIKNIEAGSKIIDDLHSSAKIIVTLPSNKMRVGGDNQPIFVKEGEEIILCSDDAKQSDYPNQKIKLKTTNLGKKVYSNEITTIDHGKIALQITEIINNETIKALVLNTGKISATNSINITHDTDLSSYMENLKIILNHLNDISGVESLYLSLPYINSSTNEQIKNLVGQEGGRQHIIRIEDQACLDNIDKICADPFYQMVMINRGSLGDNTPFEKLGIIQKNLIKTAIEHGKKVIVSSQILESTIDNFIPLRSDILDLTNIILDGASGILLTNETALSNRPAYTLSVARKIIVEVKKYQAEYQV